MTLRRQRLCVHVHAVVYMYGELTMRRGVQYGWMLDLQNLRDAHGAAPAGQQGSAAEPLPSLSFREFAESRDAVLNGLARSELARQEALLRLFLSEQRFVSDVRTVVEVRCAVSDRGAEGTLLHAVCVVVVCCRLLFVVVGHVPRRISCGRSGRRRLPYSASARGAHAVALVRGRGRGRGRQTLTSRSAGTKCSVTWRPCSACTTRSCARWAARCATTRSSRA